jgi:hypothetical protein
LKEARKAQGAYSSQSRAPVPYRQEHLQAQKGALQGTQEERCAVECAVRPEQLVHGQGEVVSVICKMGGENPSRTVRIRETDNGIQKKSNRIGEKFTQKLIAGNHS